MSAANFVSRNGVGALNEDNLNALLQSVQNVSSLRSFIGVTIAGGQPMTISLQGLNVPNDGGQGDFYWSYGAGYVDDGVNVIVPTGYANGAWLRMNPPSSVNTPITLLNYAALRAYNGIAKIVDIFGASSYSAAPDGTGGTFQLNMADTTSFDNGGTIIIDALGRRWYRQFVEPVSVKWFGAVGDGVTDDTAALQSAIDYTIYFSTTCNKVYVPAGTYKTSATIQVGYGGTSQKYVTVEIIGESLNTNQTSIQTVSNLVPTFNNAPALNVQSGRDVIVRRIGAIGVCYTQLSIAYGSFDRSVLRNWYMPALTSSNYPANVAQYSPYCGFCVDAYSGPQPATHYPAVTYPSWTGIVSQYQKAFSSRTLFEDCGAYGFVVGFMNQPGNVPDASNGDFTNLVRTVSLYNVIDYAWGNYDARCNKMDACTGSFAYTSIDSVSYGNGIGYILLNAPAYNFDNVYQLLNVNLANAPAHTLTPSITIGPAAYGEAVYRLGSIYNSGTVVGGLKLTGFTTDFSWFSGSEYCPAVILDGGGKVPVIMENVQFHGGYNFYYINAITYVTAYNSYSFIQNVFPATTAGNISQTYTSGFWSALSRRFSGSLNSFFSFFGNNYPGFYESEAFPINLDAGVSPGTGLGTPIPYWVNYLSYGNSKWSASDVSPLVCNRTTYNLSSVSSSANSWTFTVNTGFVTDAMGDNTETPFSIGVGDIIWDQPNNVFMAIASRSISGSGGSQTVTITATQLNNVSWSGSAWSINPAYTLAISAGNLIFYNSRRVYPSNAYRALMNTTSASANFTMTRVGSETVPTANDFAPVRVNDYLISSLNAEQPSESVFSRAKITAETLSTGSFTASTNARRTVSGWDAPICVRA